MPELSRSLFGAIASLAGCVLLFATVGAVASPISYTVTPLVVEGDTLPDGTVVRNLLREGVALNDSGTAGFFGQFEDTSGTIRSAVFTQQGVVAREGDTLPDGNVLYLLSEDARIDINADGTLAFIGRIGDFSGPTAVLTQDGIVVSDGDTLPDGTPLRSIIDIGTYGNAVAINDAGSVAFRGIVGDGDPPGPTAVLTQDGTVVMEGSVLPDGDVVSGIIPFDVGLDINNAGTVAFGGNAAGLLGESLITQDGVVASAGDTLPDGTLLERLYLTASGLAMNEAGAVAFPGRFLDNAGDLIEGVFTQFGLLAQEDSVLSDGTHLGRLLIDPGIGINDDGTVAFNGWVVDSITGVALDIGLFTQDGLVAVEGDLLPDGSELTGISTDALELNNLGQVAFYGSLRRPGGERLSALFLASPDITVSEPGGIALVGIGVAGIVSIRRKRQRKVT